MEGGNRWQLSDVTSHQLWVIVNSIPQLKCLHLQLNTSEIRKARVEQLLLKYNKLIQPKNMVQKTPLCYITTTLNNIVLQE